MNQPEPKTEVDVPAVEADQQLANPSPTVFDPLKAGAMVEGMHPKTRLDAAATDGELFAPKRRPPTAKLVVMDDGSVTEGEVVRIRKDEYVIGRREGDLR